MKLLYFQPNTQLLYQRTQDSHLKIRQVDIQCRIYIPLRLRMHLMSKFLSRLSSRRSKSSGIVCSANLANKISILRIKKKVRHQKTALSSVGFCKSFSSHLLIVLLVQRTTLKNTYYHPSQTLKETFSDASSILWLFFQEVKIHIQINIQPAYTQKLY